MNSHDKQEILGYIDKFSGVFNEMMQEVMQRITSQQLNQEINPFAKELNGADALANTKDLATFIKIDPKKFVEHQLAFLEKQQQLWQSASKAMLGEPFKPVIESRGDDKRFKDSDWEGNPTFNYIKQAYLLNAEYLSQLVDAFEFEDKKVHEQVRFYTRQFVNSVAPTNYVLTNPEVCREILSTQGENLAKGIDNFMRDLKSSPSEAFKITQVDIKAFTLGETLAYTPGKVIFENELIQLIQYTPQTQEVYKTPLVFFPPFINKYYILDLDEKKSMVRWLVAQGYTVFMVSWANPDERLSQLNFEDYVFKGVLAPLDVVENITGESQVNAVGYCVGGTLLAITQAYLQALGKQRIKSMSLFTTLLDFSEPGEVGNYVSDKLLPLVEQTVTKRGYFDGRILALSFSLLRENNLFWSFFIDNYLKGKDPMPFDILYWNGDSTNIPGEAFLFYLQRMYIENKLIESGGIAIDGVPIDLKKIMVPCYSLAAQGDHIVLWQAAYKSALTMGGEVRFVMTESGHVAGVVNPAEKGKYPHWVCDDLPASHSEWLAHAKQVEGSWWNDWHIWLQQQSGEKIPAEPKVGNKNYPAIEDAPGRYVKRRLDVSI